MRVLAVNAGSSSLKLRVVEPSGEVTATHDVERWDGSAGADVVTALREALAGVEAVGHRVVHGGPALREAVRIDGSVLGHIDAATSLAPLHQPRALAAIGAVAEAEGVEPGGGRPTVACFDTAFHATLPPAAFTYAVPPEWAERWGLRRYGFHGLAHEYAARRAADLVGAMPSRMVTCHLGAGASLCAVRDGRSVDTTMGFTPLEGLVMATRSGSVDPGLVLWLVTEGGVDAAAVADGLERRSGLAGLSGTGGDLRDVLERRAAGDDRARLAVSVYVHRLRQGIAGMAASLGGLDTLVFTGGVGEHSPEVRGEAAAGLGFLGMAVDGAANAAVGGADADISAPGARVRTLVVRVREEVEIARQVREVLERAGPRS